LRAAHEHAAGAVIVSADEAILAVPATDAGFDDDAIALFEVSPPAGTEHFTHRFVAEDLGETGGHTADAAIDVPMEVRSTESDGAKFDEELAGGGVGRVGERTLFERPLSDELDGAHQVESISIIR